jgi:hypothetical protein
MFSHRKYHRRQRISLRDFWGDIFRMRFVLLRAIQSPYKNDCQKTQNIVEGIQQGA